MVISPSLILTERFLKLILPFHYSNCSFQGNDYYNNNKLLILSYSIRLIFCLEIASKHNFTRLLYLKLGLILEWTSFLCIGWFFVPTGAPVSTNINFDNATFRLILWKNESLEATLCFCPAPFENGPLNKLCL